MGRLTRSVVIDVNPTDPRILGGVAIVMLAVAALAALVRRRASGVDPMWCCGRVRDFLRGSGLGGAQGTSAIPRS
jgi:hypothetical protein